MAVSRVTGSQTSSLLSSLSALRKNFGAQGNSSKSSSKTSSQPVVLSAAADSRRKAGLNYLTSMRLGSLNRYSRSRTTGFSFSRYI